MDFSKHIKKAEEAERRRNYDFAVELYQQLLEIDQDQGDARAGLRRVLKRRFEAKKGSKFLRALGGAAPLVTAKTMRKAGRHIACAKACEKYLATSPMDAEANLLLGMALEDAGHFHSARAVYEFLAEIAPKSAEGLKRAGAMMARTGDPARALEYYERALTADPRDQEAIKARKDLAAETALSTSLSDQVAHSREQIKDKEGARAIERSQRLHLSDEELQEELAKLQDQFADTPSDPDLMIRMADIQEKLKDLDAALDLVERALEYRRDSEELQGRVGNLKVKALKRAIAKASKVDEARANALEHELWEFEVEEFRRRVATHPGDASMRIQLGKRLMRIEDFDGAAAELQKAMGDPRTKGEALYLLGQCWQGKGYLDLARKNFEEALQNQAAPGSSGTDERTKEILYNLGSIAESEDDREGARGFYARVFEVDIGYRDVASKMEQLK